MRHVDVRRRAVSERALTLLFHFKHRIPFYTIWNNLLAGQTDWSDYLLLLS